jgi:hypothetical protein
MEVVILLGNTPRTRYKLEVPIFREKYGQRTVENVSKELSLYYVDGNMRNDLQRRQQFDRTYPHLAERKERAEKPSIYRLKSDYDSSANIR